MGKPDPTNPSAKPQDDKTLLVAVVNFKMDWFPGWRLRRLSPIAIDVRFWPLSGDPSPFAPCR